jgi:hypothetical protein
VGPLERANLSHWTQVILSAVNHRQNPLEYTAYNLNFCILCAIVLDKVIHTSGIYNRFMLRFCTFTLILNDIIMVRGYWIDKPCCNTIEYCENKLKARRREGEKGLLPQCRTTEGNIQ